MAKTYGSKQQLEKEGSSFKAFKSGSYIAKLSKIEVKEKKNFDWSGVIEAIIKVESNGNPNARNGNGKCVGILQITPVLVKECNNILKGMKSAKRYTLNDRKNQE